MEIVTAIVTPVVESLMVPIKKHLGYLISYTKYVRDMGTKMSELKATRLGVEDHINQNKSNCLKVPMEVSGWLEEVGNIEAQVESIPSDVGSCFNLKVKHKLGRKAFKIIQDIDRLKEEKSRIDWTDHPIPLGKVDSMKASTSAPSTHHNDFKSRELTFMEALKALEPDHKSHMIALCGMGGVGKTVMVQKLKKVVTEKKLFDFIIEATIGEKVEVLVIQQAIADFLGLDLKESTKEARAIKLRKGFEARSDGGKKKFLIILDDVWQFVDLNDIGLSPLPNQGIDFKVLLTSRTRDVCTIMGVELNSIIDVKVIENSEAHNFFLKFVKYSDDDDLDHELREIGEDIANRCQGLPIAIKTIALSLKGKRKHVWEDARSRIESKNVDEAVRQVFEISYKNLHNEETRSTLLLCCLFPEDFDTPIEELVRYGWGLRLFDKVDTIRKARNRLNTCIDRLIDANLLIQGEDVGCVKMHDLVRDFVLHMCSKGEHASVVGDVSKWPEKHVSEFCKRISITCTGMSEFPRDCKFPNLLLLKLMNGEKSFPDDFYQEMKKLEVIVYERMTYPLIPISLQYSSNLRMLCIHKCSFMFDCSPVGDLLNLEVLSFIDCRIQKLPSTIGNLTELKLLDLTGCSNLRIDDGVLKSLVNLEELYMRGVRRHANGDELVECSKNLEAIEIEFFGDNDLPKNMSFEKLERFKISLGCSLMGHYRQNRHSFENTLMLATNKGELLDSRLNVLFGKTKVLHMQVDGINDLGDCLGESLPHLRCSFFNLKVLHINECANLKYLFTINMANGLKQLEHLKIIGCPVLETLVDNREICKVEVITFPSLKFLSLKWLPKLISLCTLGGDLIEFPQLEVLELDNLPSFTSIYRDFLKKEVMSSKLKKLKIFSMEKLKEIWPSELSNNGEVMISQLRGIEVSLCDSLVNLFPSNPMSLLHHLEELSVWNCHSIDVIFNIDLGSSSSSYAGEIEEDSSSNLRSIKVEKCGELREVWRVKGVNNSNYHLPILGFQSVEFIHIEFCKRLRNVFTPTTSNFDMRSLKKITIKDIDGWGENKSINEEINVTSNQDISEVVDDDDIHNVAFPCYLILSFHQLHTLELDSIKEAEVVFKIDSSTTQNNQQLPHLKDLYLSNMERMTHVWKYDWNQFLVSQQEPKSSSFLNITNITLKSCDRIKYLFSPLMAKLLSNLIKIQISWCDAIEEVVSNIDVEYEEMDAFISSHTNTTFFPHLETLELFRLKSLKRIDGVGNNCGGKKLTSTITASSVYDKSQCYQVGGAYWSSYQYAKTITIRKCRALLTLIPSHAVGHMPNLEKLEIFECKSMREIFESHEGVVYNIGEGSNPRPIINMTLPNLKTLYIYKCNSLEYIFTRSVFESLKKLQELTVKYCSAIQVIVKQEDEGSSDTGSSTTKMTTLLELPNLKTLHIEECNSLEYIFTRSVFESHEGVNNAAANIGDTIPRPIINMTLPNLKTLHIEGCHGLKYIFTRYVFESLKKLKKLKIQNCSSIQVIVKQEDEGSSDTGSSTTKMTTLLELPNLKTLHIEECNSLEYIFTRSVFESLKKLKKLKIQNCSSIQVIVKQEDEGSSDTGSSTTKMTTLLELPNLITLHVEECNSLEYIFTSSVLESLKKLEELTVKDCSAIQVIVKQEDNGSIASKEVVFPHLTYLKLVGLPILKGFFLGKNEFRWLVLDKVEMYGCPQMKIFTRGRSMTPKLKYIDTGVGKHSLECGLNFDWTNAPHEEENQLYNSGTAADLLQFPWSFSNLIELDVDTFHGLSRKKTIFPSNELVNVGDIEEENDKVFEDETQSADDLSNKKQLIMSMDHPPTSSSYIWKWKSKHSSNLSNLTKVSLDGCDQLEHVFSYGMAATLVQLQHLHIRDCNRLKVIVEAVEEDSANKVKVVSFPCLKSLQLYYLQNLKGFCLGSHDEANFEWPVLDTLEITYCPEIIVFTNGQSTTPKLKIIETSFGLCEVTEDLNFFIRTKLQEGYEF